MSAAASPGQPLCRDRVARDRHPGHHPITPRPGRVGTPGSQGFIELNDARTGIPDARPSSVSAIFCHQRCLIDSNVLSRCLHGAAQGRGPDGRTDHAAVPPRRRRSWIASRGMSSRRPSRMAGSSWPEVKDACHQGTVTPREERIVAADRVLGWATSEIAAAEGATVASVQRARSRALRKTPARDVRRRTFDRHRARRLTAVHTARHRRRRPAN